MGEHAETPGSEQQRSVLDVIERLTGAAPRVELRQEASGQASGAPSSAVTRAALHGRGNYRLVGEIARGGMGVVLRGRDQDLRREVAVKVLHSELARRSESVQRFVEEAQICGQLQHPGVVPVYELGLLEDERPFFTMKLIRGRTFAELLLEREETTSERRRMLEIFMSVCQTMAYVHSRGVIHRDLKPANVMVGAFGEVQVVDWGLAKVLSREGGSSRARPVATPESSAPLEPVQVNAREGHSLAGAVMGTLSYMPPEQARGEVDALDERADVFALGAILCEILTGGAPYSSAAPLAAVEAAGGKIEHAFAELDDAVAEPELVALCKQCLAPDREQRPRNAHELVLRMQHHFEQLEQRARAVQIEAAEARVKAAEERRARKLTASLAASVVVTALVVGGGWYWTRVQRDERERATRDEVESALSAAGTAEVTQDWNAALAAVERARTALQTGAATESLVARVDQLDEQIRRGASAASAEREQGRRNRALLSAIEQLLSLEGIYLLPAEQAAERDAQIVQAFADWGVAIDDDPIEELAQRFLASGVAVELALALDQWCWRRVIASRGWDSVTEGMVSLAIRADPEPVRVAIREALRRTDTEALLELSRAAVVDPLPPPTAVALNAGLLGVGRVSESAPMLRASAERHPDDFQVRLTLAVVLDSLGDEHLDEAVVHYSAARALQPDSALPLRGLGTIAAQRGDLERAERLLRQALELSPDNVQIWNEIATVVADPAEQERCLRRCLELSPSSWEPKLNLGRLLHMTDRPAEAVELLRAVVAVADREAMAWSHLGTALSKSGQHEEATRAFERSLELDPNDIPGLFNLSIEQRRLGRHERALELCERAHSLAPEHPLLNLGLGVSLAQVGREREAVERLRTALELESSQVEARQLLARLLADAADPQVREPREALEQADAILAFLPYDPSALVAKCAALVNSGEFEQAASLAARHAHLGGALGRALGLLHALSLARTARPDDARNVFSALDEPVPAPADALTQRYCERLERELREALGS